MRTKVELRIVNNHAGVVRELSQFGQSLLNAGYTHAVVMDSLLFTLHRYPFLCVDSSPHVVWLETSLDMQHLLD